MDFADLRRTLRERIVPILIWVAAVVASVALYLDLVPGGPVQGFKGLVNGEPLWIDKTTAGILNDAAPTGAYQFQNGNALGSDTIFVRPGTASPVSA